MPTDQPLSDSSADERASVRIRRAPKFSVFLIVGAFVGVIVALVLTASFPIDKTIGFGPIFGYFALFGVIGGMLLGALVALIFDRISTRRARSLTATVSRLEPDPDEPLDP